MFSYRVRLPAEIHSNQTSEQTVVEGEDIVLNCPATGYPHPRVEWRRKDRKVLPDTSSVKLYGETLQIDSVRREDRGEYSCTADNQVSAPVSKHFTLKVRFGPRISVPRPRVHQALSHGVSLVCDIEAYPAPAITWTKNGVSIVNEENYFVVHFSRGDTLTASTVKIDYLNPDHFGIYECHASNIHGEATQRLELIQTKIPIPVAHYGSGVSAVNGSLYLYLFIQIAVSLTFAL
ncbi:lachesin [Eurytemora carolleeae]|uniref:lachesin n=1 Tax=Eurytemora carolleeae TaxID=1294199 RepID=UPI000C75C5B2|nr:lachesin [Eurytemora carolleeae]|eukprot:XP_023327472.1 lachesin-like [Eurytemora affinis]